MIGYFKCSEKILNIIHSSSQCYKTLFGGKLEYLDSPETDTTRIGHFKSNVEVKIVLLHQNSTFSHF